MGQFTPNLNLYKAGGGSTGFITPDEVADIDKAVNDNLDKIDTWADTTDDRLDAIEETAPHTTVLRRVMSTDNVFTNQTSYADFPETADAEALTTNFLKNSADTKLVIRVAATANYTSGTERLAFLGVRVSGTDYDVAQTLFPTATNRQNLVGEVEISGVGAGLQEVKARFKTNGSSVMRFTSSDAVCLSITETS